MPMRPELDHRSVAEVIDLRQQSTGILEHDVVPLPQDIRDDELRLGQMR